MMNTMLSCPILALLRYRAPASAIDVTTDMTLAAAGDSVALQGFRMAAKFAIPIVALHSELADCTYTIATQPEIAKNQPR